MYQIGICTSNGIKHVADIMSDKHLRENNILYWTKNQILRNENVHPTEASFEPQFLCQSGSSGSTFCSTALCSWSMSILQATKGDDISIDDISIVVFQKEDFSQRPVSLIILDRSPSSSVGIFLNVIWEFVRQKLT